MRFSNTLKKTFTGIGIESLKYHHGKIYKIISPNTDKVYIGSTHMELKDRLDAHRWNYDSYHRGKFGYLTSFDILKAGNYRIELLEDYPCHTKKELEKQEGIWQKRIQCVNLNIAGRTIEEWRKENKEHIKQSGKTYREKNKEIISQKKKMYREKNKEQIKLRKSRKYTCECGSISTIDHKTRHVKTKKHQNFLKQ